MNYIDPNGLQRARAFEDLEFSLEVPDGEGGWSKVLIAQARISRRGPGPQPRRSLAESLEEEYGVSEQCARGMVGSGKRGDALDRANGASSLLKQVADQYGLDWTVLAAIGVRESGFRTVDESGGGLGRGVFQIDLGQNPNVTAAQANDLTFAATFTARYVGHARDVLRNPGYSTEVALAGAVRSWNRGLQGTLNLLAETPTSAVDRRTANGDYVSNVLDLADCFR